MMMMKSKDIEIVQQFRLDLTTTSNIVASELGLPQWFAVNTARLYPYHYTPVYVTEEEDNVKRLDFMRNADSEYP